MARERRLRHHAGEAQHREAPVLQLLELPLLLLRRRRVLQVAERVERVVAGLAVAAGSDGRSAAKQMERICKGWRLRPVAETLISRNGLPQTAEAILRPKQCPPEVTQRCTELGGLVAATLLL